MMRTKANEPLDSFPDTSNDAVLDKGLPSVDASKQRFPFCIVWGPLPLITWLFPFIGHMGIGDSEGRVHDFAGPYYIGVDDFMTGSVCKYYQFPIEVLRSLPSAVDGGVTEMWDDSIAEGDKDFGQMMHNLCCNNCHHHTAKCLRYMGINHSMLSVWWLIQTKGRYTGVGGFLKTYAAFFIIIAIILMALLL